MDDNTKVANQNTPQVVQADQAQTQAIVQPIQPVALSSSGGVANKEIAPVLSDVPELKPAGPEVKHELSQELKEIGIEEKKDRPDLTSEHQEMGVNHAGPHVPVSSSPSGKVTMPMSEEEITDKLKTGQDDDSGKWLAALLDKLRKIFRI